MKKKKQLANELNLPQKIVMYLLLVCIVLIMAVPMWNVLVVATSSRLSASQSGVKLWWDSFSLDGFEYVFTVTKLLRPFLNSFFVTTVATVIQVVLSSFAGYVLIQKDLPFKGAITSFVMLTMMIPGDLTLISVYQLNKQLNLLNSYTGLIMNGLISGFSILLMRNFFETVPYSLAEAARIDGCGPVRTYFYIFLPLSKTILATLTIMKATSTWNDFFYPLIFTQSERMRTVQLALRMFKGSTTTHFNWLMAATLITVIPMVIVYFLAQKQFVQGIASTGMKN